MMMILMMIVKWATTMSTLHKESFDDVFWQGIGNTDLRQSIPEFLES